MIVKEKRPWYMFPLSPAAVFLAPAAILYTVFFAWPAIEAFYVSLTEWGGFAPEMKFVGLSNFRELLYERKFWRAIGNNFIFMFGGGVATFFFALLYAAALSNRKFPGRRFFKTILFAPYVVSVVGIAILWTFIYDPSWGLANAVLSVLGKPVAGFLHLFGVAGGWDGTASVVWLGSAETAIPSLVAIMVWGGIGFYLVLLMAGIDRIPDSLYEAARIDGASEVQNFFYITLPLLRDVLVVAISVYIIGSLKTFGLIWAMTRGGNQTHVMGTYMYEVAFDPFTMTFRMGYGTAMTVILFLLVIIITFTFNRIMRRTQLEY